MGVIDLQLSSGGGIMKKIIAIITMIGLSILLLFNNGIQVNAKTYYDTKYNNRNTKKPYSKVNKAIAEISAGDYLGVGTGYRSSSRKDFNGDGKKEKVAFIVKAKRYDDPRAKIVLKINGRVAIVRKDLGYHYQVSFSTMKIQGKCLAVLMYGDEDFASGGALIYLWKNNNKLKLLKEYKTKGYLHVYTAKDKSLNKNVLYIEDDKQLLNRYGEKWPSNVLKKYKKYAKQESTSVTKSTYYKLRYKNGRLSKVEKDNYYRVGINYD